MRKLGAAALLMLAGACKPSVRGQCVENSDCRAGSVCGPQHICQDLAAPAVTIQVMPAGDSLNGWFPRTRDNVEVRAFTTDGAGSGVAAPSATLKLDTCPAAVACSYEGVPLPSIGPGVFSFQVPRFAQPAGAESALSFKVSVTDNVGNVGVAAGVLQIDDVPPSIGTPFLVTAGTAGEDGQTWFLGGPSAPDVEVGIPISDSGSGVASLALQLAASDVASGTALTVPPIVPRAMDGSIHFRLPANAVQGREGALRFSLVAMDMLQHVTSRSGDSRDLIWVDAVPPSISLAKVDYSSATSPPGMPGCAPDAADFACGRQAGTPAGPHLLRDDTATVTFDALDCGAGVASISQFAATVKSGGQSKNPATLTQSVLLAGNCANGSQNSVHRFSFPLNLVTLAPTLDSPPDATGTSIVRIDTSGKDVLGHTQSAVSSGTSGDGIALVSWWRWRRQVGGNLGVTGSPALLRVGPLDPAGARRIVLGTDASTNNFYVLNADGSIALNVFVLGGLLSEAAVGATNLLYVTTNASAIPCPGNNCANGTLAVITPGPTSKVVTCAAPAAVVGTPPAVVMFGATENGVAAAQAHSGSSNLFLFSDGASACTATTQLVNAPSDFKGVTATATSIFMADTSGFSSLDQGGNSYNTGNILSYNGGVTALAPPAIALPGPNPVFGGDATDHTLRRTSKTSSNCPLLVSSCWQTDPSFNDNNAGRAASALPYTPVFDGTNIWTTDANGSVYAWAQNSGKPIFVNSNIAVGGKASPPVLLVNAPNNAALVVTPDGALSIVDAKGIVTASYGNGGATGTDAPQVAPVLDVRSASQTSVAYVAGPGKWLYAWQIPWLPLPASNSVWPRPGRDSCNSRNTSTATASCP